MKIIREYIKLEHMDFKRTGDSLGDMKIGEKARICQWLDMMDIDDYYINGDLSINVGGDVNIVQRELGELPEFIRFNKIWGGFYAGGNPWQSLRGFPNEIYGDLQIYSISNYIDKSEISPKINEKTIKKIIRVHGNLWI